MLHQQRGFAAIQPVSTLQDDNVTCLMLHPITWPNHGPNLELYLAEEAIGLVRSLNWLVANGPLWKEEEEQDKAEGSENQTDCIETEDAEQSLQTTYKKRTAMVRSSHAKNTRNFKKERIRDGDYKGGIIIEFDEQQDEEDEWLNDDMRESVARSCMMKVRLIHSGTFFTKGKLNEIGYFLKEKEDINVVFINYQLTSLQQKKLEKRLNDIVLSREERLRKYYLKSAQKEKFNPTDIESESSQMSELETQNDGQSQRKIRVIDRFGIILQIFAQRAKTRAAQLQIELAWLKYARTMLVRGGAPTFGQIGNIFQGNLMRLDIQQVEIKSAKGKKTGSSGTGSTGGEGETQLEIERRRLNERENKLSKELDQIQTRNEHEKAKKEKSHQTLPLVALIGYTNAGKTALMNLVTGSRLESEDQLFQTLNTTHKRFRMPNGQMGLMLDTVGFITNLPHGLVGSFKATLEEIHFADLLIHVRDISHPQTNYQRDTVIKVLREIGIPDETLSKNYIEVWNKIDLLKDQEEFTEQLKQDMSQVAPQYPVVMMSCTNGTNRELFLNEVQVLSALVMGKKLVELKYKYSLHNKIAKWLQDQANIIQIENMEYDDDMITIKVPIDDVIYQKYLKEFEPEKFADPSINQKRGRGKMTPPPGWNN